MTLLVATFSIRLEMAVEVQVAVQRNRHVCRRQDWLRSPDVRCYRSICLMPLRTECLHVMGRSTSVWCVGRGRRWSDFDDANPARPNRVITGIHAVNVLLCVPVQRL